MAKRCGGSGAVAAPPSEGSIEPDAEPAQEAARQVRAGPVRRRADVGDPPHPAGREEQRAGGPDGPVPEARAEQASGERGQSRQQRARGDEEAGPQYRLVPARR